MQIQTPKRYYKTQEAVLLLQTLDFQIALRDIYEGINFE
jgi:hypothetical protein